MTIKMKQRKEVMKEQMIRIICLRAKWVVNERKQKGIFVGDYKDDLGLMLYAPLLLCDIVYESLTRMMNT